MNSRAVSTRFDPCVPRIVGISPDRSPFGSQTVTGPGWPNVDEEALASAAVAANARLATLGGGEYLLSRLDPATPADLADAVRTFANDIQDIGMNQLVGIPNADPRVTALLGTAQGASERTTQMCT